MIRDRLDIDPEDYKDYSSLEFFHEIENLNKEIVKCNIENQRLIEYIHTLNQNNELRGV